MAAWWGLGLALDLGAGISAGILGRQIGIALLWTLVWWLATSSVLFATTPLLRTFPGGVALEGLGLPNGLTAVRAYLALPVLLFAVLPPLGLGRALFLAVAAPIAALDAADGFIARRVGPVTVLGRALDPVMDTVFFSICAAAAWLVGLLPAWLAAIMLVRYGLPALGFAILYPWLRRRPELVATGFGKVSTLAGALAIGIGGALVLAGGPAGDFDLAMAVILAAGVSLHFGALYRRTWVTSP
ncbi:MAG: CDP-alcohol phosphatidyltransferase family protein [Candidatus Dormibacteria bacterium]